VYRSRGKYSFNAQEQSLRNHVIYGDCSRVLKRGYTHYEQRYNALVWTASLEGPNFSTESVECGRFPYE